MTEDLGSEAARLLVDRAWEAYAEGRWQEALSAAGRAAEAATRLDDLVLLVRALSVEGEILNMTGDFAGGLARYTRILALAEDPATSHCLNDDDAARTVASARWNWVACARYITSIPVRDLFGVLDAADRWLDVTGHRDWRASVLSERADVHAALGEWDAAIACANEALLAKLRHPDAAGYNVAAYRHALGEILIDGGRAAEAVPHFRATLDDPRTDLWDQHRSHQGLAECALAAGDLVAAEREMRRAVQRAESLGDDELCNSLGVLARVCQAAGDLTAAWQAAARRLEVAGRIGGHHRPYQAARVAVDIALDRADYATARRLLDDLDVHARAMDAATATTTCAAEVAERRQRLEKLA